MKKLIIQNVILIERAEIVLGDQLNILTGETGSGKSSLLASLADCVAQSAFGYSPRLRPALQPIGHAEFRADPADASRADLFYAEQGDYERLRRQ